jgi:hypothetical protein
MAVLSEYEEREHHKENAQYGHSRWDILSRKIPRRPWRTAMFEEENKKSKT